MKLTLFATAMVTFTSLADCVLIAPESDLQQAGQSLDLAETLTTGFTTKEAKEYG